MVDMLSSRMIMDIETDDFVGLTHPSNVIAAPTEQNPYEGLNRAQRRAAMSKERRAFRKRGW